MKKRTGILGVWAFITVLVGIFMKLLHFPGAGAMLGIGSILMILGFFLSFLLERISLTNKTAVILGNIIAFCAAALIIFGAMAKLLHWPGATLSFIIGALIFILHYVFFAYRSDTRKFELRNDRQLASILFTDIVGYSSMMGNNEATALQILNNNRKIQKPVIKRYQGRWLKEMGDGTLSVFFTASDAVLCAMEIMEKVNQIGSYRLRMGIHIGEIVFAGKDVFGDGVNVASRIMDEAREGGICISEAVYHNIKNQASIRTKMMGEVELKNVSGRMRLYKIED